MALANFCGLPAACSMIRRRARLANEQFRRDVQRIVKRPHHRQCQWTFAGKYFGNPIFPTEERRQVFLSQAPFFHAEPNGLDGIGLSEIEAFLLVVLDELGEQLEPVAGRRPGDGIFNYKPIDFGKIWGPLLIASVRGEVAEFFVSIRFESDFKQDMSKTPALCGYFPLFMPLRTHLSCHGRSARRQPTRHA